MAKATEVVAKEHINQNFGRIITRLWPGCAATVLACGLIYGVGMASPSTIHDMAHDSRHSASFPCH